MNKKNVLIILGCFVAIGIVVLLFYWQTFHKVTLDLKKNGVTLKLYSRSKDNDRSELSTISGSTALRLQNGNYSIIPQSEGYDSTPIDFSVQNKDTTITIDPSYSKARLDSMLLDELNAINTIIAQTYPSSTLSNFNLARGELLHEGEWYITTLGQIVSPSEDGDLYRTVLKKESDTWKIAVKPSLIISSKDYPDIPPAILRKANKIGRP